MDRAINDNDLLRDISRLEKVDRMYKGTGIASLCGIAIGCVWFLCVAAPAGALWK